MSSDAWVSHGRAEFRRMGVAWQGRQLEEQSGRLGWRRQRQTGCLIWRLLPVRSRQGHAPAGWHACSIWDRCQGRAAGSCTDYCTEDAAQRRPAGTLGLLVCRYSPPASCRAVGGWPDEEKAVRAGASNVSSPAACCPVSHVRAAAAIPIAAAAYKPRGVQHQRHLQSPGTH